MNNNLSNMEKKFKPEMTFDEMAAAFVDDYPWLVPNNSNVGRYAKRNGYMRVKQMINKVMTMKYVKIN